MTDREREKTIMQIINTIDNWELEDLIDYVKMEKRRDLDDMSTEELETRSRTH